MMWRISLFLVSLALVAAEEKQFSFYEYFTGEWDVQRSTAFFKSSTQNFEELPGHYSIHKENGTVHLIGRYFQNDTATGELTNELAVAVDFETPNSGSFKIGATEYDVSVLFKFEFIQQPNGMVLSHGEWLGSTPGYYQFAVGTWDKFTITILTKETEGQDPSVLVFTGKKVAEPQEKSFFQKYGTFALLGGVILVNMFLQRKTQSIQANHARAAVTRKPGEETPEAKKEKKAK